jgi:hypothetical protein
MKQTPICEIIRRLRPLSLSHQIAHLRALIQLEKPHSFRRGELEALLKPKLTLQLKRETRAA